MLTRYFTLWDMLSSKQAQTRHGSWWSGLGKMFAVYFAVSCIGIFTIHSEEEIESFYPILAYFALPLFISLCVMFRILLKDSGFRRFNVWAVVAGGFTTLCLTVLGAGPIFLVNAFVGTQDVVLIHAPVTKKEIVKVRRGGPAYQFVLTFDDRQFVVNVGSRENLEKVKIGDIYRKELIRGSLGFYYQMAWKRTRWEKVNNRVGP